MARDRRTDAGRRVTAASGSRRVLVVDVGGSHVKIFDPAGRKKRLDSGPRLTPRLMASRVKEAARGWRYDRVSIGFPGPVIGGRPLREPLNLGGGWLSFDYGRAFGRPVKIVNDAAMQALGSYGGGRMLFLGLGTGLGSALVWHGVLVPMELGHLPYKRKTFDESLGTRGLKRLGRRKWARCVFSAALMLKAAFVADDVVIGGGNAKKLPRSPKGIRVEGNHKAYAGGLRLWSRPDLPVWRRR